MTVESEYDAIIAGAGWCTDNYIRSFSELSDPDQYRLMVKLARAGLLYDEEGITEEELESDNEPSLPSMNVEEVNFNYRYLIGEI